MLRLYVVAAAVAVALGDQNQEPTRQQVGGKYDLGEYGLGGYGLHQLGLDEYGRGEINNGEYAHGEIGRGEYGRGEYGRGEHGRKGCCGGLGEKGYDRNAILEGYALVNWVEPLKGVKSHAPAPVVAIQNKIVQETYSPDYYQPVKVIDYRYLRTGRDYSRGRGGQVIILPAGVKDSHYGSYDDLLEKIKLERHREREERRREEHRPEYERPREHEGYSNRHQGYGQGHEHQIHEPLRGRRPELVDEPVHRKPIHKIIPNYHGVGK